MVWRGEKYTGPDFQLDFFGKKVYWPAIMKEKGLESDKYIPYKKAMGFVLDNYPIEAYPTTKLSQDIYDQVAEELGFDPDPADELDLQRLKKRLKFYDSLHTPLDDFHGVDGFFVFTDEDGSQKICTLDATLNPEKGEEDVKADVWVGEAPDSRQDPEAYEDWYRRRARAIGEVLGSRSIKSREEKKQENRTAMQ